MPFQNRLFGPQFSLHASATTVNERPPKTVSLNQCPIEDFPDRGGGGGTNLKWRATPTYYLANSPDNCMNIKNWVERGLCPLRPLKSANGFEVSTRRFKSFIDLAFKPRNSLINFAENILLTIFLNFSWSVVI